MTKMTSDVEALAQLAAAGPAHRAREPPDVRRGRRRPRRPRPRRWRWPCAAVLPPLVCRRRWFRRASGRSYLLARERSRSSTPTCRRASSGVRVSQAFSPAAGQRGALRALADARTSTPATRSVDLMARYFPFIQLLSVVAKAIALAVGATPDRRGPPHGRRADRLPAPTSTSSSPRSSSSPWSSTSGCRPRSRSRSSTSCCARPTTTPAAADPIDARPARRRRSASRASRFAYATTGLTALHGLDLEIRAGRGRRARRHHGRRQVDARQAGRPLLRPDRGRGCSSTACRSTSSTSPPTGTSSATCPRSRSSSPAPSAATSPTAGPTPTDLEVERAARAVGAHEFVASLPLGLPHAGHRAGRGRCRPASGSSSAWPGPSSSTRRSCCSTRRPPTSTSPPRPGSRRRWACVAARPHDAAHRPPAADRPRRAAHPRRRGRPHRRGRQPRRAAGPGGRYAELWSAFLVGSAPTASRRGGSA